MNQVTPVAPSLEPRPNRLLARLALGLALGAATLVLAAHLMGVSATSLGAAIALAPGWMVPASAAALFFLLGLGALRWNRSMRPVLGTRFWQAYWAMLITYAFNAVLPAHSGDLLRVNILAVRTGRSRAAILGAEIMDKGMDFCGPMPVTALLLGFGRAPTWLTQGVLLIFAGLAGIALFVLASHRREPSQATWLGRSMSKLRTAYLGRSARELLITALIFASLPWLGESLVLYFIGHGFGIPLTGVQAFCVLVALKVGMAVPTPGGIGSVEVAGAAALVFFGAAPASALALMLLYRTSQLAAGSVTGAVFLAARSPFPVGPASRALMSSRLG